MNENGPECPGIRVLVVADHDLFRTGLASLLGARSEIEVVAQASGGRMGVELASRLRPDVVLIDLRLPDFEGSEAIREILRRSPATRVLALTVHSNDADLAAALQAGACGVLAKDTPMDGIVAAVRAAADGSGRLSPRATEADADRKPEGPKIDHLSPRELDVLALMIRGLRNAEIAENLRISRRTAGNHVTSILAKLARPRGYG